MIAEINELPRVLRQPMDEELAWELLWNDPLRFVLRMLAEGEGVRVRFRIDQAVPYKPLT